MRLATDQPRYIWSVGLNSFLITFRIRSFRMCCLGLVLVAQLAGRSSVDNPSPGAQGLGQPKFMRGGWTNIPCLSFVASSVCLRGEGGVDRPDSFLFGPPVEVLRFHPRTGRGPLVAASSVWVQPGLQVVKVAQIHPLGSGHLTWFQQAHQ